MFSERISTEHSTCSSYSGSSDYHQLVSRTVGNWKYETVPSSFSSCPQWIRFKPVSHIGIKEQLGPYTEHQNEIAVSFNGITSILRFAKFRQLEGKEKLNGRIYTQTIA